MTSTRAHRAHFTRLAFAAALAASSPAHAQEEYGYLYELEGAYSGGTSFAKGVNLFGTRVVGSSFGGPGSPERAFIWRRGSLRGLGSLGLPEQPLASTAYAVNSLGTLSEEDDVVVGSAQHSLDSEDRYAFRWTYADGMKSLGTLNNGPWSKASAVNYGGTVVVGHSADGDAQDNMRAFRWTQDTQTMVSLGVLNNGNWSSATGVNIDGSVVVGEADDGDAGFQKRAFRWTDQTQTMVSLGTLNGSGESTATGVDASGKVVVGMSSSNAGNRAYRWTESTSTMQDLGVLSGFDSSWANAVSADGLVVVGASRDSHSNTERGFRWTSETQMQTIEKWLEDAGVPVAAGIVIARATGVSADGNVVVGDLASDRAFIARVETDQNNGGGGNGGNGGGGGDGGHNGNHGHGGGSGLIVVDEYMASLSNAASAVALPLRDADPVLHGAHGDPMGWLLAPGQTSIRVAGDIGRTDRSGLDVEQDLGEVGIAHAFSSTLQGQVALGTTRSSQTLAFGGRARTRGTYVLPELIWQARPGLYASFSAYFNEGDLRLNRAYINAGTPDFSYGESNTTTTALRARLDWRHLWQWNEVGFTPYTSLTLSRTTSDAYTETGGGFPVIWDKRKDKLDVFRLGLDGVKTFGNDVKLTGRVELAHRIGGDGRSTASGSLPGLMGFTVDSTAEQRAEWLRLGVGIDLPLGPGRFSTTLNATTHGSAPAHWLAASYRVDF